MERHHPAGIYATIVSADPGTAWICKDTFGRVAVRRGEIVEIVGHVLVFATTDDLVAQRQVKVPGLKPQITSIE